MVRERVPGNIHRLGYLIGITLLAALILSGHFFTAKYTEYGEEEIVEENEPILATLAAKLEAEISVAHMAVEVMAQEPELIQALQAPNNESLSKANYILDQNNRVFNSAVCYLMDLNGTTIAASNRDSPKSFVGKNYGFRPYFQEAIAGGSGQYFALGVTSGTRGHYASFPVNNTAGEILGVVVMKRELDRIEEQFDYGERAFFVSPQGIIFLSSEADLLMRSLWPLNETTQADLEASNQFGSGPFTNLLEAHSNHNSKTELEGETFISLHAPIGEEGWSIVVLASLEHAKFYRNVAVSITTLAILVVLGFIAFVRRSEQFSEQLASSEARFRVISTTAEDSIIMMDHDGCISYWNPAAERTFGHSSSQILGQNLHQLLAPTRFHKDHQQAFPHFVKTGEGAVVGQTVELVGLKKDGSEFPVELSLSSFQKEGYWQAIGIARDITFRKEQELALKVSEERYRELFENASDLIQSITPEGEIRYVNRAWLKALEYSEAELKDLNIFDIIHPECQDHCLSLFKRILQGEDVGNMEVIFRSKNGHRIYLEGNVSCKFENGNPISTRGIFHDITDRKENEEALKAANEELDAFVRTASHDLRSPLVSLSGFLALLKETEAENLTDTGVRFLERIEANSKRMEQLLDDLLKLSRAGREMTPKQVVDLTNTLEFIKTDFEPLIEEKKAQLVLPEELPKVHGETSAISQIFTNLISNGLKYMGEEEEPLVELKWEREDGHHHFQVMDNGIGIDPAHHERVFESFQTLQDERAGVVDSTGVGLNIVQRIVERHGGRIWVESDGQKGSVFHFTLDANLPTNEGDTDE